MERASGCMNIYIECGFAYIYIYIYLFIYFRLSASVHTNMMRVMCTLLDPDRDDATRGKWQLSERMDRFALSFVAHLKCDTCCQEQL